MMCWSKPNSTNNHTYSLNINLILEFMVISFIGEKMIMQIFTFKISYTTELVSPHCFKEFQDFIFNKKIVNICSRRIYIVFAA